MSGLPIVWLWAGWLVTLTLTIVVGKRFTRYDLATSATPGGILEFELAGDATHARRIVDAWRAARVLDRARPNLRLDMVWIPCYTATLALSCVIAMRLFEGWWAIAGAVIAVGQVLAGLLDYGENFALLRTLDDFTNRSAQRTTAGAQGQVKVDNRTQIAADRARVAEDQENDLRKSASSVSHSKDVDPVLIGADRDPPGESQRYYVPPRIAAWCARMKLRLLTLGVVYLLIALLLWLLT